MGRMVSDRADTIAPLAETFREHGYEGASLALIGKATGLGKGSLYHFFPEGKADMLSAVLADIDSWFEDKIFEPLRTGENPADALSDMFSAVMDYFRSGQRVCLMGVLAISNQRDQFGEAIATYFVRWVEALEIPLWRQGRDHDSARLIAEEIVAGIQGGIVLARALDDPTVFERVIAQIQSRSAQHGAGE